MFKDIGGSTVFSKSYVNGQLLGSGSIHDGSIQAVSKVNLSLSVGTSATG